MTEWQWQVILSLIRVVLGVYNPKDEELLKQALQQESSYIMQRQVQDVRNK